MKKIAQLTGKKLLLIASLLFMFSLQACDDDAESETARPGSSSRIDSLSKKEFRIGDTVSIFGSGFGAERSADYIEFGGVLVEDSCYIAWSDTKITVIVPDESEDGSVYLNNRKSNEFGYEINRHWVITAIDFMVQISLFITVIFLYLKINKIWKRKHELEVADSQSLSGLFIYICNSMLWVVYYVFVEYDMNSIIDTSFYIFEGSIFFIIGTGIFVRSQRKEGLWTLIMRALKLERKEVDYLLKKWFKPQNAEAILDILHQIAMIDNEFDPKEQEIIQAFAKEWNIDYDLDRLEVKRRSSTENNFMAIRNSVEKYLDREPPAEQVAQLKDMITTMIEADDKVTEEEQLISDELLPMIENFLTSEAEISNYLVLIVPQRPEQEESIVSMVPHAEKINASGGVAFSIGSYYSRKYAEMICDQYREINYFTIVNAPIE